jgi:dCTP deaminase
MLLNDRAIRALCLDEAIIKRKGLKGMPLIEPFSEAVKEGVISYGLTHAGYDLRLGHRLLVFRGMKEVIDPKKFGDQDYRDRILKGVDGEAGKPFLLSPYTYALGFTLERLHIPTELKGRCVGKSTLARSGVLLNTTPLEPGWHGHLTLEISNVTPCPAILYPGEGIAQLELETLLEPPEMCYGGKGGKYQGQGPEPTPARVS